MFAIFLVGGLGTRLRPFTFAKPKALLPVLNQPFISYQFELLKNTPVKDIVLAAGQGHSSWEKAIQKIARRRFRIHFVYEKELLGTGGAIRLAYDQALKDKNIPDDVVLVFNGDVFFDVDIQKMINFHLKRDSDATMALTQVEDPSRFGLVTMNKQGGIEKFIEKPSFKLPKNHVNGGIYAMSGAFIRRIQPNRVVSLEREVFPVALKEEQSLFGFETRGYWNDIGTTATYRGAHGDLLKQHRNWTEIKYLRKRGHPLVHLGKKNHIHSDVQFEGFVSIGSGVRIDKGCVIRDSVIHNGSIINEGAQIFSSVLGENVEIGHHSVINENTFLGVGSKLSPYTKT